MKSKALHVLVLTLLFALALSACTHAAEEEADAALDPEPTVVATVNGVEIAQDQIDVRIAQMREGDPSLTDEAAWIEWLTERGYTPDTYRDVVLNGLIDDALIEHVTLENGTIISDEEIDASLADIKVGYKSDEDWLVALERMGYTEEQYRAETKTALHYQELESVITDTYPEFADIGNPADRLALYMGKLRETAKIEMM